MGERGMGREKSPPKLCYRTWRNQRPEPAGMMTPPVQAPGRVPFRWEEAPGKPRNSSNPLANKPVAARKLELPPRLITKGPDAEVLQGTYFVLLDLPQKNEDNDKRRGSHLSCSLFTFGDRSFRFGKRAAPKASNNGDSLVLPRSYPAISCRFYVDDREEGAEAEVPAVRTTITRHVRSRSVPGLSTATAHLLASIYGGLKRAAGAPWTSRRKRTAPRMYRDSLR